MPCNKPYTVYKSRHKKTKRGKPAIEFNKKDGVPGTEFQVKCGSCYGCRLEHSRTWAFRNMHEAQMHDHNQFITFTYNDDNLPHHQSLHKPDLQKFFKRLRKSKNIRYYACGEYGDKNDRPHYHAIIFGLELTDLVYHKTENNFKLFTSKTIAKLWKHGAHYIGESVTFESCAYVSRYIMKKWKARSAYELEKHYERIDKATGLVRNLLPEFQTMSRRPGIGFSYYKKFASDIYQIGTDGKVISRGNISCKSPTYYDYLFEQESTETQKRLDTIKEIRRQKAEDRAEENTPARLKTKEHIAQIRATKQLPRNLK